MEPGNDTPMSSSKQSGNALNLVALSPSDKLALAVVEHKSAKATLVVRNNSDSQKVIYKVKTRRPKWWHVWPVQHMLDVGQQAEVHITLQEPECTTIYRNRGEGVENKHLQFLVQARAVTDEEFHSHMEKRNEERPEDFKKLFAPEASPPEKMQIATVVVDFQFDEGAGNKEGNADGRENASASLNSKVENMRDKLAAKAKWAQQEAAAASSGQGQDDGGPVNDRAVFQELQALRKKFDAILEYTCHLTQERDHMANQIKELKRQQLRGEATKENGGVNAEGLNTSVSDKAGPQGFSLMFSILIALLAFFVGRFLRTNKEM